MMREASCGRRSDERAPVGYFQDAWWAIPVAKAGQCELRSRNASCTPVSHTIFYGDRCAVCSAACLLGSIRYMYESCAVVASRIPLH